MSRRNKKFLEEFKNKLESKGVDLGEFEDYFKQIESNLKDKKYGLVWENHTEEIEKELLTKFPILKEEEELKVYKGEEYTNNFLIEGDNLESLTALKNMGKKVDVIYLDPPYNTGNRDFVYEDRYVDTEDGFRHSKWLSFMEKRLKLARELLTEDGVIFISIDDNEQANLKLLCDSVYGEENFVERITWLKGATGKNDSQWFKSATEVVYVYSKRKENFRVKGVEDTRTNKYKMKDEHYLERGGYYLITLDQASLGYVDSLDYGIKFKDLDFEIYPNGREFKRKGQEDEHRWRWGKDKVEWGLENGMLVYKERNGKFRVYTKQYEKVDNKLKPIDRTMIPENIISGIPTRQGKDTLTRILGNTARFSYPKPENLIKYLIDRLDKRNATVLDFFAGSGTTGHAVLELNKEDGGNRNFILCTNNENNICRDVTYQRLNKVINGYTTPKGKEVEGLDANLTYLKTELISKEEDYIELEDNLLEHAINTLKVKNNISEVEELIGEVFYKLEDKETEYYIYNNFYVDETEIKLNNEPDKKSIIYVNEDLLNDSNLLIFDEVRSIGELLVNK